MLNKIIYYSLHNRLVVLICSLLLMIARIPLSIQMWMCSRI